jgi:hypothetical protein
VRQAGELVRRVMEAHNRGGDALLDLFDDVFDPDFEFRPRTVGTVGSPEPAIYRGRASGATVEEDIALVYWARDGRLVRGEGFRSVRDAREAARA